MECMMKETLPSQLKIRQLMVLLQVSNHLTHLIMVHGFQFQESRQEKTTLCN